MEDEFTSYQLLLNSGSEPSLVKKSITCFPSNSIFVKDESVKTSLIGGFSTVSPQTDILLSPSLQLNGDIGTFSTDELRQIALAELNRKNSTTFRSYIKQPENRVAVIAKDKDVLTTFLETYGAVLEIDPLLVGSYHPDYQTAEDLNFEPLSEGYRISYMVRKPVNLEKCTYCGNCGPVCSEDCLDEQLFIDMSRCTYCKECVKVCPSLAIDLYRAEKYTFEFPNIIFLDQTGIELPSDRQNIFFPDELENLFSSLVPFNIEETISWTSSTCQYSGRLDTGCNICLEACHHSALGKSPLGITISHQQCVECGACLASCPTGSLQNLHFSDQQFIDWFSTVALKKDSTIIIGSEKQLHKLWWKKNISGLESPLFLEHQNTRSLSCMHLLLLLSLGAKQVLLLDDPASCEGKPISSQVRIANSIFNSLFNGVERISIATSNSLGDLSHNCGPSPFQESYSDFTFRNRREKLGSILSFLIGKSSNKGVILADEPFHDFGSIDCDAERCTHCGACLNECRIGSLTADSDSLTLDHKGILCVQCSTCVEVCPEDALKLNPGLMLTPDFLSSRELTKAEPVTCLECGKPFGTRKSFERIVAILREKNPENMNEDVLEYCETCRVVKMFEAQ